MSDPPGNSPSKYNHLFRQKPSHVGNIKVLSYISSICEDDCIERLENNQWKCLWCNVIFYGINDTKYIAHAIRIKCMQIKRCKASIDQDHFQDMRTYSLSKLLIKVLLMIIHKIWSLPYQPYRISHQKLLSQIFSITPGGISSSNITETSDTSSFRTICSTSPKKNQINPQKCSIFVWVTTTYIKWWLPMRHASK